MTIQTRKSQNTKIGKVESDAYLPTESGNFRVSVTPDENGMEHALLYVDGFEEWKAVNPDGRYGYCGSELFSVKVPRLEFSTIPKF